MFVLATWLLIERRYTACLVVSLVGLFFKEFLLMPSLALLLVLYREYQREKSASLLLMAITTVTTVAICFVLPRLLVPVIAVYGNSLRIGLPEASLLGYLHNLRALLSDPLDPGRLLNIVFASGGYWLPSLVLLNRDRFRRSWLLLSGDRLVWTASLASLAVLTLVGGTNIMIFVTYAVAAQAMLLSAVYSEKIHWLESLYALAVVIVFNRLWTPVPSYEADFFGAIDMFGGWGSRLTVSTAYRVLEMAGYLLVAVPVRHIARQMK